MKPPDIAAAESTDTLVWVIVGTTITLLGMALGALVLMKNSAIDEKLGSIFVILSFLALVVVEGILLWRLLQINRGTKQSPLVLQPPDLTTEELNEAPARVLLEPAEPLSSITEETTRAFEPLPRKGERR